MGASGAGKTTLLNILGGMDSCTEGRILIEGQDISHYSARQLTEYRRYDIGFVFQFYNLVRNLTARENVELAAPNLQGAPAGGTRFWSRLDWGTAWRTFRRSFRAANSRELPLPGRWQRNPKLLLCDEPTGALDYKTGKAILKLLQDTCRNSKKTVAVITHNQAFTALAGRVIQVSSGKVTDIRVNQNPMSAERIEW